MLVDNKFEKDIEESKKILIDNLKAERIALKMSIKDLATAVDLNPKMIELMEGKYLLPNTSVLLLVLKGLNLDINSLFILRHKSNKKKSIIHRWWCR